MEENGHEKIISLRGMYKDYFLDYASYVILERAIPGINDGLKPVQRRILHAMYQMDDGRYHKVANIIGQTMQYHPHGDAAIGDALVALGQKDLLIDCQGNWGDVRTGDAAAAARYIEARLTPFARHVVFNPKTTRWQASYDGRNREPVSLPVKFPLLLAQGVEGIAVGLSTRILPHNFSELVKGCIQILKGKTPVLYPDFPTGGLMDVSNYQDGSRGGRILVRARIEMEDKKTLLIKDIPYGVTTPSLIDSIVKAGEKGKIKIKKVIDNTAENVEIVIQLQPGVSPELTMDALYAFTACETSIAPNACVIVDDKPMFLSVAEILEFNTRNTRELLKLELEIKRDELLEKIHAASLEKIFIEQRVYHEIEECTSWEEVISTIHLEMHRYISTPSVPNQAENALAMVRDLSHEDILKLTEIKIKRISKYNTFEADKSLEQLGEELETTLHHLAHLTDYTIAYFEDVFKRFGKGRERKTEITRFDNIEATQVVANNAKLYVNRAEGFIGFGIKKEEFVTDCSDIDDIIVFRKDGVAQVSKIAEKVFVGKDIIHVNVWKKGDDRTTYNMIYLDGESGKAMAKRFQISSITRDREYSLVTEHKNSKVLYFSANPNGESESVGIQLSPGCKARIKKFSFDFAEITIKGRSSKGNMITRYPVKKITQESVGKSTLGAQNIWVDEVTGRLNTDERGLLLGSFDTGDLILVMYRSGEYELTDFDTAHRYEMKDVIHIGRFYSQTVISAVYFDGERSQTLVKRFRIETSTLDQKFSFISEHKQSKLLFASIHPEPVILYTVKLNNEKKTGEINLASFIDIKGWKALGNKLSDQKLLAIKDISPEQRAIPQEENTDSPVNAPQSEKDPDPETETTAAPPMTETDTKPHYKPGDTVNIDFKPGKQQNLFDN